MVKSFLRDLFHHYAKLFNLMKSMAINRSKHEARKSKFKN